MAHRRASLAGERVHVERSAAGRERVRARRVPRRVRAATRGLRRLPQWAPPAAAWLAALAFLSALALAAGAQPWSAGAWSRWDSGLYEDIARHGYTLFSCESPPSDWCGNAAWFPAYPWLIRAVSSTGLSVVASAVVLAWVFALAALVAVWRIAPRPVALAYAAFAPGQIYDYAAFPLSLLALLTLVHLSALARRRWLVAGAAGAVAAMTYPLGAVLAPVAAVWIVVAERERVRALALAVLPVLGGLALVEAVQWIQTGSWDAFLRVQAKYGNGFHDPFTQTVRSLAKLDRPAFQTLVVTLVLAAVLVDVRRRRRDAPRLDLLLAWWAVATWAVPLTQANLSVWRSQAALLPLALLVARLPRALGLAAVALAVAAAAPMALLFFHNRLI